MSVCLLGGHSSCMYVVLKQLHRRKEWHGWSVLADFDLTSASALFVLLSTHLRHAIPSFFINCVIFNLAALAS